MTEIERIALNKVIKKNKDNTNGLFEVWSFNVVLFSLLILDKHLQHSIEKSQTSNQSTENRSGILENETTTQREETGEENLISSYEDLRKINRDEEVLSETVSVNKDEGNKTQNETQEDDEESLANKEVIPNDSSSATLDLVSKTENVPNTEIKKNTEHGKKSQQMIS